MTPEQSSRLRQLPTERQGEVLAAFYWFREHYDYSPTIRELSQLCGLSEYGARPHIEPLIRKGYLIMESGTSRSLRPSLNGKELVRIVHEAKLRGGGVLSNFQNLVLNEIDRQRQGILAP